MAAQPTGSPLDLPPIEAWGEIGIHDLLGIHGFTVHQDGTVTAELALDERHENPAGKVHGGAVFTLLDSTNAVAVLQTLDEEEWMATASATIDFLQPASGTIEARSRVDRRGKLTAYVSGDVQDSQGHIVARASAVWAIRRKGGEDADA